MPGGFCFLVLGRWINLRIGYRQDVVAVTLGTVTPLNYYLFLRSTLRGYCVGTRLCCMYKHRFSKLTAF